MKVLLINPMITRHRRDLEYPLNLIHLAAGLKDSPAGISVTLLDLTLEYFERKLDGVPPVRAQELCVKRAWQESGPFDLVGISGFCDNFHLSVRLAEFVKNKFSVPVVMGGPHATFVAEDILRAFPFVDYVIRNDGVGPLRKLCELPAGGEFDAVPALVYRDPGTGRVRKNPRADGAPDVMSVSPDYGLIPLERYLKINPSCLITILAGTGCPFQCTYCSTSLMWDRRYRVLPPKAIAAIMRRLKKKFPDANYSLVHDNLLCGKKFALELCSELKKVGVSWGSSSRLEHIAGDRDLMLKLKAAGCRGLFVGIETGSAEMQRVTGKKVDLSTVVPFARDCAALGFSPVFSFILGFPEETDEDRDKTLRLAFYLRVLQAERVNLCHLFPLPGTAIAEKGPFSPGKKSTYRPPQLAADARTRKLVYEFPYIFRSFWSLPDRPGRTALLPSATQALHGYGVDHYRSFNYLFRRAGVRPSALFGVLGREASQGEIFKTIKRLAGRENYEVFSELFRYEVRLNRLVGSRDSGKPAAPPEYEEGRKYSLTGKIALFRSSINIPSYLGTELPAAAAAPAGQETLLCLVDGGKEVETFEIQRDLFSALNKMRAGRGCTPRALLSAIREKKARLLVERSLRRLLKMGALSYA